MAVEETGCCPRFVPEIWDDKEFTWKNKLFVKDHVRSVLHIPLGIRQLYAREQARIETAGAQSDDHVVLADERSPWGADYYFAVTKEVPEAELAEISGTFITRAFEGPFRDISEWVAVMRHEVEARGKQLEKLYFWYTTCPRCAKVYGKNYVVLFAKVG